MSKAAKEKINKGRRKRQKREQQWRESKTTWSSSDKIFHFLVDTAVLKVCSDMNIKYTQHVDAVKGEGKFTEWQQKRIDKFSRKKIMPKKKHGQHFIILIRMMLTSALSALNNWILVIIGTAQQSTVLCLLSQFRILFNRMVSLARTETFFRTHN